jgi:hypothetical protein
MPKITTFTTDPDGTIRFTVEGLSPAPDDPADIPPDEVSFLDNLDVLMGEYDYGICGGTDHPDGMVEIHYSGPGGMVDGAVQRVIEAANSPR